MLLSPLFHIFRKIFLVLFLVAYIFIGRYCKQEKKRDARTSGDRDPSTRPDLPGAPGQEDYRRADLLGPQYSVSPSRGVPQLDPGAQDLRNSPAGEISLYRP